MNNSLLRTNDEITKIYKRNVDMVYRICFAYLKNNSDTEDALQDTFIKLLNHTKTFETQEHEKAWLIVTASNICKNKLKHWWNKRKNIEDYENTYSQLPFEIDETFKIVMSLPEKYKVVIYLYYYEGYNSVEIANIINKPQSTVRNYLHDARKILKNMLGGDFNEK